MRLDTLIHFLIRACIVILLISSSIVLNAAAFQSKNSFDHKIYSCREVKKFYTELEKLSRDKLRKYLFEKFKEQYNSNPMKNYTYAKYYVCRFYNDHSEQANYWKKWIGAFEKKLKSKDGR
jgi:hypothetical protein